jgi:hypothetical protein
LISLDEFEVRKVIKEQSDEEKVSDDKIKNIHKSNKNLNIASKIDDLSISLKKDVNNERYV